MSFRGALWKVDGPGGWTFVTVPDALAPDAAGAWGRIPVVATVDGHTWDTSLWRSKTGEVVLAVPKRVRGKKAPPEDVDVSFRYR